MVIISAYLQGEMYGLLGPQLAAAIIRKYSPSECIVVALPAHYMVSRLKRALRNYFGSRRPIVGFSNLCGREDLVSLAGELKKEGAITILAGPQAAADYCGEEGWRVRPHRFKGFSRHFTFALDRVSLGRASPQGRDRLPGGNSRQGGKKNPHRLQRMQFLRRGRGQGFFRVPGFRVCFAPGRGASRDAGRPQNPFRTDQ